MQKTRRRAGRVRAYTVFFQPDLEAGGYTVHVPALGIVTEGDTLRQARAMAKDAIEGRLAVLQELEQPLPKDVRPERVEVRA